MEQKEHRRALITGASAGLGAEFARQLAARGYDLVLAARRRGRLEELAQEINRKYGVEVEVLPVDLSTDAGITLAEERIKDLNNLEMLVNNAGFGIPGGFLGNDIQASMTMVSVHVAAPVRLTRAALPVMVENGRGYMINVSSISAFHPAAGESVYSATKAFLVNFSESLATELNGRGVKVQALCPGFVHTEFHDSEAYRKIRVKERLPGFMWMNASEVVQVSLKALKGSRVVVVPGFGNWLLAGIGRSGLGSLLIRIYLALGGRKGGG